MKNECCKTTIRDENLKKDLSTRINRLKGQVEGVGKMVEEDRYCGDVLMQLAAIEKSAKSLALLILDDHTHNCVCESVKKGDAEKIDELTSLFRMFL